MATDSQNMNDTAHWIRHYDTLLWTVTTIFATAIGGLFVGVCYNFKVVLAILGLVITPIPVFFAASFRQLRFSYGENYGQQGEVPKWVRCQWHVYVAIFVGLEFLWQSLLVSKENWGSWPVFGWIGLGDLLIVVIMYFWHIGKAPANGKASRRHHTMSNSKPTEDRQMNALAGEFFVAAELLKRRLLTSVTFGNAKAIDLFAYNRDTQRTFTVQVKALRKDNYFLLGREDVKRDSTYVFVVLNEPGDPVQYFVVPGEDMADKPDQFGNGFADPKLPGIQPKQLRELRYEDNWGIFQTP